MIVSGHLALTCETGYQRRDQLVLGYSGIILRVGSSTAWSISGAPRQTRPIVARCCTWQRQDLIILSAEAKSRYIYYWLFRSLELYSHLNATLQIKWVGDDDSQYDSDPVLRAKNIAKGRISWHTCFKMALIPASKLLGFLRRTDYDEREGPGSASQAIAYWLLSETLSAIGNHGVE